MGNLFNDSMKEVLEESVEKTQENINKTKDGFMERLSENVNGLCSVKGDRIGVCSCGGIDEKAEIIHTMLTEAEEKALEDIETANKLFLKAKYELYETRANFYTKENRVKCKEETGKDSDTVFKEYFRQQHLDLEKARDEAEFKYYQALRRYESI